VVVGFLVLPFVAGALPFGGDSAVAAPIMKADRCNAGIASMQASSPDGWRGAADTCDLRGKVGFFAGSRAKPECTMAEQLAGAVAPSLERPGVAEARAAAQTHRGSVEAQREAGAPPIPKLGEWAQAAVVRPGGGHRREGPGGALAQHDDGQSDQRQAAAVLGHRATAVR
jgi:hypothetical protein